MHDLVRYKAWYFSTVAIGTGMETVGFVFRILSSKQDPYSVPWFVVEYFFNVVAPVFFSAAIYAVVSVLINIVGRQCAPLPPKFILWFFITCDIIATITQVAVASLIGVAYSHKKDPTTPNHHFTRQPSFPGHFLCSILGSAHNHAHQVQAEFRNGQQMLHRSSGVCDFDDTAKGLMNSLSTHEVYFGCLEFAPIVLAVYTLIWYHPGKWLPNASQHKSGRRFDRSADGFGKEGGA
ncbi:hypothetical protein LTR49_024648 [Elasticomyces elasticus]|nr:hypothetical protein LTR49_024648 [Elasticomyces elasticus]